MGLSDSPVSHLKSLLTSCLVSLNLKVHVLQMECYADDAQQGHQARDT